MLKMQSKICLLLLCLVLVLPTISSASTHNTSRIVGSLDESAFYDAVGNLIEIFEESDGTIVVYINGILDHTARTDLSTGTVVSTEYFDHTGNKDKQGMKEKKTIYKLDDLIKKSNVKDMAADVVEKPEAASSFWLQSSSFPPSWPYNQGYTYRNSYNNEHRGMIAHGYYKRDSPTYTSSQAVSFLRNITIGTAVSLVISALGGPLTVAIVSGAIVSTVGSYIIEGVFTRNVDVNVNIKIEWEAWLAIVNDNNHYAQQGTQYLRVMNQTGPGESTKELSGKVGFLHNFTEFLRQSSWA